MKILIVLAAAFLVPIMMKFQQYVHVRERMPRLQSDVQWVLTSHGVEEAEGQVLYLDARIWGLVDTAEKREEVARAVDDLRGVRLKEEDNRLMIRGWLRMEQKGSGVVEARGEVPQGWKRELLRGLASQVESEALLESERTMMGGAGPSRWGVFCDALFREPGVRLFEARGGVIDLSGEVTPAMRREVVERAQGLAQGVQVRDGFTVFPSLYHFRKRALKSGLGEGERSSLEKKLAGVSFQFEPGQVALLESGKEANLAKLTGILLGLKKKTFLVLGVHPDVSGPDLAKRRANFVRSLIFEQGIERVPIRVVEFEALEGERDGAGRVEILVE